MTNTQEILASEEWISGFVKLKLIPGILKSMTCEGVGFTPSWECFSIEPLCLLFIVLLNEKKNKLKRITKNQTLLHFKMYKEICIIFDTCYSAEKYILAKLIANPRHWNKVVSLH